MRAAHLVLLVVLSGCAAHPVPVSTTPFAEPDLLLAWEGHGDAYIWWKGGWQRYPSQDYDYVVVQRRWPDRWRSRKEMLRRNPAYRGDRGSELWFEVDFGPAGDSVPMIVRSSMGPGQGAIDPQLRTADIVLTAKSPMWNRVRFHQEFRYGEGRLVETVELYTERKDGSEKPFIRIEEQAVLLAPQAFDATPGPLPP